MQLEGDANSDFFQMCVKARTNKNIIKALSVEGGWLQKLEEVRKVL